jgi:ubiquinone biosynthesis protein Coq4
MFANWYPHQRRTKKGWHNLDHLSERMGRNLPPIADINDLRKLPEGTFGRAWADYLDGNQLTPFPQGPRRKQLHDGIHVVTGYGSDAVGEAELQAFLLGTQLKLANVLLLLGLLRFADKDSNLKERLWQAYQRGRQSYFNSDIWQPERLWLVSLEKVRDIYRV